MTIAQIQEALRTGFNKQGRTVSDSMRIKYMSALTAAEPKLTGAEYRGFAVSGKPGKFFVDTFPTVFTSRKQALEAVDHCIAIREEMANEIR